MILKKTSKLFQDDKTNRKKGPLTGYRVLEFGSTIAGPFCARLLADFGADVIKVEPPSGDPVRHMGRIDDNESLYAASILRNKRLISVDVKTEEGNKILRRLMEKVDVVIENFRPGTLEKLGLGYEEISKKNPGLVLVRISGFGQTGPYSPRPGYGVTAEAIGGVRHMIGEPDLPPARVALAVTDHLGALYGAFGAMMALLNRKETGTGQIIDTALYEAAFSMMEPHIPAYDRLGIIPKRAGSKLPNTAPNNLYITKENDYILIASNNDATFRRLAEAMGKPELAEDPKFKTLPERKKRAQEVDQLVENWTKQYTAMEIEEALLKAAVPVARVFTIKDIFNDAHFRDREQLVEVPHEKFKKLTVIGVAPKLSSTPGSIDKLGGKIGRDNESVLMELLNMDKNTIEKLEQKGVIFSEEKRIKNK